MSHEYTEHIEKYINSISDDSDITTVINALENLKSGPAYNLPFSQRFSDFLFEKRKFSDQKKQCEDLVSLYKNNILPYETKDSAEQRRIIERVNKNIKNWLEGRNSPSSSKTRDLIYKICFALSLTFAETEWFFNDLCFQRCFNPYINKEIIYYYCFNNQLNFEKAVALINKLNSLDSSDSQDDATTLFTYLDIENLSQIHEDEEFIKYYKNHPFLSENQNRGAMNEYKCLYTKLKPNTTADETVRKSIKSFVDNNEKELKIDIRKCSPFIFEQFEKIGITKGDHVFEVTEAEFEEDVYHGNVLRKNIQEIYDFFNNQLIRSDAFFLRCIYGSKDIDVEKITFFPSEKTLSELNGNKLNKTTKFHEIRKCLILFYFFYYWNSSSAENLSFEGYRQCLDDILYNCCYEPLYPGNSYDRIFLVCSKSEDPIETFRAFIYKTYHDK